MHSTQLKSVVESAVTALGFEMVNCEIHHHRQNAHLRVFVDSANGVTVADCERVSRQIYSLLAVDAPGAANYGLEVSSPGLDRELIKPAHYQRFIGREIKIKLLSPLNERKNLSGLLLNATHEAIEILTDGERLTLELSLIEKTNLIPEVRFKS